MAREKSAPVLLVESDATSMLIISELLAEIGFENIDSAADSADAMAMLTATGPRLVIADLHLEPNGLDFFCAIR